MTKTKLSTHAKAKLDKPCKFFQTGSCRYGSKCKDAHIGYDDASSVSGIESSNGAYHDGSRSSSAATLYPHSSRSGATQSPPVITILPALQDRREGLIPVNNKGWRLDYVNPPASEDDWYSFSQRTKKQKLCNEHHLRGYCTKPTCSFDHGAVSDEMLHVLRHVTMNYPCSKKGDCRRADCYNGHICQKDGCQGSWSGSCKLTRVMHTMDPYTADWVPAVQSTIGATTAEMKETEGGGGSDEITEAKATEIYAQKLYADWQTPASAVEALSTAGSTQKGLYDNLQTPASASEANSTEIYAQRLYADWQTPASAVEAHSTVGYPQKGLIEDWQTPASASEAHSTAGYPQNGLYEDWQTPAITVEAHSTAGYPQKGLYDDWQTPASASEAHSTAGYPQKGLYDDWQTPAITVEAHSTTGYPQKGLYDDWQTPNSASPGGGTLIGDLI
ncbi:hypothetical protein LTR66_012107 [Elasticomyces elasticus]|nr:hypothetical protein LTR66_012107 [Elasticomyces elasticus]